MTPSPLSPLPSRATAAALLAAGAVLSAALPARADVPAWVDGPVFKQQCADLRATLGCPACRCEAVTQTPPGSFEITATDYLAGLLVELEGEAASGQPVHQVRAILGHDKQLYDGGAILDLTRLAGPSARAQWHIERSKQLYDMCPGACEHDAVGAIHAFELEVSVVTAKPGHLDTVLEHRARRLTACFERDKAPVCVTLPLGAVDTEVVTPRAQAKGKAGAGKERRSRKGDWSRTWDMGGKAGMQLIVSVPKGKLPKGSAVAKAPRASYFQHLAARPDAEVAPK